MLISTKGRYALRVMIDLAEHADGGFLPMKDVALRQGLSLKYLEQIMPLLVKAGLVEAVHGKGGGYRLTRDPGQCTAGEILRLTEGDLVPVACLQEDAPPCARAGACKTLPLWRQLNTLLNGFFDGVTLQDLMAGSVEAPAVSAQCKTND